MNFWGNMQNRAIILAAGRGSRMGDETASKPKCLTRLAGKQLLEWQIKSLKNAGIHDIIVIRGYRAEMIQGAFGVIDNPRWKDTNMVASLFCAPAFEGNTIISYSDIVYKNEHVINLNKSKADITITADKEWEDLWNLRFENPLDDAETFKSTSETLTEIGGKTRDIKEIEAQYMGLLKLSENGWKKMNQVYQTFSDKEKDRMDMTSMLNVLLKRGIKINVVFIEGGWCEADNYSDIVAYEKELNNTKPWRHDWR